MHLGEEIERAAARIGPFVRETLLEPSSWLSEAGGADVHLKLENLQVTGSFKARGAMNKVLLLDDSARSRGVVTASTGNHGAAVAFSLRRTGTTGLVFVPENAARTKVAAIQRLGAEVRFHGTDGAETESFARRYAEQAGATFISPYNDAQVIAGQGTIGMEIARRLEGVDAVFASLGGGGLIGGIASYLDTASPRTRVYACSPENSQVMIQSIKAGRILDLPSKPTISDGTAGGVEPGAITFALLRDLVDEYVTVSEAEIRGALRAFMDTHHMMIEGAAAVALAAYLKVRERLAGKTVVIVICGANISLEVLESVL